MSTGQAVGAVAGGAVGFFVGGPTGALYGAQIGMAAGGYLDPPKGPTQSGPRLSDTSQQTSTYGATIPRVYGTIGVLGNIFWLEHNKLKEVVKKKKSGGKGGGSSAEIKTYTYYGTFAVGLCEGPIAGVRRIWVGPDLLYDAGSDDLETIIASNQASSKFSIYLGTADQQPDPRMQAEMGVANCPAYRGLAYVVVKDLLLTKYGNSIMGAQVKAEVVTSGSTGVILSRQYSQPYSQPHTNDAFMPKPYFVSAEKIIFYAPQWESDYPDNSSWAVYEFNTGGLIRTYAVDVEDPGVPPDGDTDSDTEAWKDKSAVFSGGASFYGADGYIQRRGQIYAGLSTLGARRLYLKNLQSAMVAAQEFSAASTAVCFAIVGDHVYTFATDGIRIYNSMAVLVSIHLFILPDMEYPSARAEYVDGELLLFDGSAGIYRISADLDGYSLLATIPDGLGGPYFSTSVSLSAGLVVRANPGKVPRSLFVQWLSLSKLNEAVIPLAGIFEAEFLRSKMLVSADIDVSLLTDTVIGYKVANIGSIRAAIEPLQGAFPFDVIQSGYKIKAVPRSQSPVSTIDIGDLGIDEQLRQAREMDTQLPTKIVATYLDKARNYDANEQFWERPSSGAVNTRTMELPIVMAASQALQVVERLGNLYWLERTEFGPFTLPPTFGGLEPGDVVTLHAGYANYELRLTTVNYQSDGSLSCSAKLNNPSLYISQAASDETPDATIIALAGASLYALLDIPVVDETLQNSPGMVGVMTGYTNGWPGGVVYRSPDEGQTWDDIQAFSVKGTLGYARGVLGVHAGNLIDYGSTLTVDLLSGEFSAITEAQMLNGANMVAYGAHGRWEILRFAGATLNADGSRTISTLIRGDRGTEWATGLHVAGDLFVLLDDPDGAFITMPTELIGAPRTYRGITSGADIDSATSAALTYQGVNLTPLSPVYPAGSRNAIGDLAFSWTRRSRLGSSWWATGVPAPAGEMTESYEVDVMSGATVKRTISTTSPAATYTASEQNADFGSAQPAISLRIYQLSSAVGRGLPLEVTL